METNLEKKNAGEYMESNHFIFWSGSHPENKIGIYIMGGCDLPSVFSCVPLIKPILKGTCCILKEGQIEKSRSDILLQNLKDCPQDLLAPVLEKFYLPGNFFDNQLFSPSFGVSNGSNFEEFPKQVVILSIAPDVARVVYQHREHGFLIDPSGWWNNQRMDLMLRDLSSANWFRKHFVSLGRMTLETFIENFTQLINQIKQATNVHILVFNTLTIEPGNITHNYQFVKRPESLRRREFNLALVELSRKLNFWIVDIDKVLKQTRTKNMVDFAHFPVQLYQPIGQEVFRILEELEIFQVPTQSSKDSSRQWILGMTSWEEQVFLEDYTKNEYSGRGEIVELGCWLGSSTIPLARGLEANSQIIAKNQRINAYDIFTWVPAMEQIAQGTDVAGKFKDGDSFLNEYLKRINPWSHLIQVHPGNLTEIGWEGRGIEFLFIDAMKSWELTNSIIKNFFPSLIPGFSSIVHQDFAHYYETWIHLIMYRWREYFIPVDLPEVATSKVFRYIKQIPNEVWHYSYSFDDFSEDEVEAAFDYSLSIVPPKVQRNVIAAKVMYFIHVGNWERAKLEFERATAILEREHWQELAIVEAHLSPEKHDQILKDWGVGSIEWYLNMYKKLSPQEQQTQTLLKSLQTPLDQNTQELKVQQLENQAKAEIDRYQESLQQVQEQTKIQIEHLQTQLQQTQVQLQQTQEELVKSQSDLQYSEDQLKQIHSQVQQTKTELTQSQLELHICQTELGQFKSYLRQTQGVEGIRSYYRSRIASNPDDIQLYHQALEIKPDDAQVHLQLGRVLIRQNRPKDAITSYQTALQFQPDNFEIYLELGKALEKEKKWEDAITSYRRAIKLNPDYSWSHKHLGDALAQLGKIHEASTCYHRALQIQPRIF